MAQISGQQEQTKRGESLRELCHAPVTLFALPKPFVGDSERIQTNAICSWMRLQPAVNVLLIGDEEGIGEFAVENGVAHVGAIERNDSGTPLISSAFEIAHRVSSSPILVYCNADVILDRGFVRAMEVLSNFAQGQSEGFLGIGQRTDLSVDRLIDFANPHDVEALMERCKREGEKSSAVCKEYFAFSRNLYQSVPPFAVGRGNWDNWMVARAHQNSTPVVDLTSQVLAIHQKHDYGHSGSSRMACYVNGTEARENQRLAGGRNLIVGSTASHVLENRGVKKIGWGRKAVRLILDVPRFARLLFQLLVQK